MSPRRIVVRALLAVGVAASIAGLSVPAAQARGTIYVQSAPYGVSPTTNVGLVSVSIEATTKLKSLTVSVYTEGAGYCTGTDELNLPMSDFVVPANDGGNQLGTWTLAKPITTSQLTLGAYQVCITAADKGGDTLGLSYVGPLYFFNTVEFQNFKSSRTTFSYDHQNVTLSGDTDLLAPDGTTTPFGGKTLTVAGTGNTNVTTVTGADGSFSVQFQVLASGPYWVYYPNDGSTYGSSPSVTLTVKTFAVHITATLSATHVNEGKPVSVHGTVTYDDNGVRKPLAGNTVWLCGSGDPYPCDGAFASYGSGSAVTNASGNYTMRVPTTGSDVWTLQTTQTTYFPVAKVSRSLTVALANAITSFKAHMDSFANITYTGCVTGPPGSIRIEYAAKPAGPWYRLRIKPFVTGTLCTQGKHYGSEFEGTTIARLTAAYYRATSPATSQWQAATSRSVYLWKYLTKITSFSVRPQQVGSGGHIRVSGRLWTENAHHQWRPYSHRRVLVIFRYQGTWYRYRGEPLTNLAGWFKGRFPVYASSPFFSQYDGDKTHFACASVRRKVTVGGLEHAAVLSPRFRVLRMAALVAAIWR